MTKKLNLQEIRIDGGTQARVALDLDTVAEYTEFLRADDANDLPPVIVFFDGTDKWLADGFHRQHSYTAAGRVSIPADVRTGTQRDAILFACGANAEHGLKRTNEDKRKAVGIMLADAEWSARSDRDIAKHCGVSHTFVANMRNPKPVAPPAPPAPPKTPKTPAEPQAGGNVATPPGAAAQPPAPPATPADDAAAANAEAAHGGTDLTELLQETQRDLEAAQRQLAAANADDAKAEAMKWQRIADVAVRRQNELMQTVKEREEDIKSKVKALRRIGRAVGEEDPDKVAATVEEFVRAIKVSA